MRDLLTYDSSAARNSVFLSMATLTRKPVSISVASGRDDIKRTYKTLILIETIKYHGHLAMAAALVPVAVVVLAYRFETPSSSFSARDR